MSKLNQTNIVSSRPLFGRSKNGKKPRLGTEIVNGDGEIKTLLTPAGKGAKAARELKENKSFTNDGKTVKKNGLTKQQRAYRAGYLQARKDNSKAFKAKGGKK